VQGVCSDHEVGKDAPWTWFALSSPAAGISLECPAGDAPGCLIDVPVDRDSGVSAERSLDRA
jgi:hypothetical protein